jgi:crossover junction endodeoxyribonuclease RuvC
MAHARGAILLAAAQRGLSVTSYAATRIKKAITGSGRAGKEQIQLAMLREFRLREMPEPHDVADALAIALCHYHLKDIPSPESSDFGQTGRGVNLRNLLGDDGTQDSGLRTQD